MITGAESLILSQELFLADEFHRLSLQGAVQRANIYVPDLDENERKKLHPTLRKCIEDAAKHYEHERNVSDDEHNARIEQIRSRMSEEHARILRDGIFRIGPAQKAFNLFLKYQWCAGWIARPPHCPFDSEVIKKLGVDYSWRDIDDIASYQKLVDTARKKATEAAKSLAQWELDLFNEVSPAGRRRK
jgi:hypothetical protein